MTAKPEVLLASASPRRRELLKQIGVRFAIAPVGMCEDRLPGELPADYVRRLALAKAQAGFEQQFTALPVLGADTAVVLGDTIFGKPENETEAASMLAQLSGRSHQVLTGVAVVNAGTAKVELVETLVHFRDLNDEEVQRYCATGEPMDKAGSYGIQGFGAVFVDRIAGSYTNVVGLPLAETSKLLQAFGIGCWNLDVVDG